MISLLRGKIAEKSLGNVIIDVHGVGYGVTVPLSTYYRLPETGFEAELKIHTSMKDSGIELFGFLTEEEKAVFTLNPHWQPQLQETKEEAEDKEKKVSS